MILFDLTWFGLTLFDLILSYLLWDGGGEGSDVGWEKWHPDDATEQSTVLAKAWDSTFANRRDERAPGWKKAKGIDSRTQAAESIVRWHGSNKSTRKS